MSVDKNKTEMLKVFGSRIQTLRRKRGLSQEELASEAGLDRSYVGGIERGQRNPTLINLNKICKALKMTLSEVLRDL